MNMKRLEKAVVLIGMPGSGKTTFGSYIATSLNIDFLNIDSEIEVKAGMPITEIFKTHGETYFRALEQEITIQAFESGNRVIATGGGSILSQEIRQAMKEKTTSVYLKCSGDVLYERLKKDVTRPLLQSPNPKETLQRLYDQRKEFYEQADITLEMDNTTSFDTLIETLTPMLQG